MSSVSKARDILQYKKSQSRTPLNEVPSQSPCYLDLAAVAPSPSRDYFRIYVTKSEVALTQWRISHGARSVPIELKVSLDQFGKDIRIPSEVGRVFGKECVDYISGLCRGHVDKIIHLPIPVIAKIFHHIGIEHLKTIAPVCSKFAQICRSDELWGRFYLQYGGQEAASIDTKRNAEYLSWKSLFFINRLHFKIGNPERFTGLFSDRHMNILSNRRHSGVEGGGQFSPSNTSIGSSSTIHSQQGGGGQVTTKMTNIGARETSSGSKAFVRTRTTRLSDGLVPRASAPKMNESPTKKGTNSSPRQKATRYTLVQENVRKNPTTTTTTTRKYNL